MQTKNDLAVTENLVCSGGGGGEESRNGANRKEVADRAARIAKETC
jgi:hypothetical protein